jgi:AraC-like DNA-binding protein
MPAGFRIQTVPGEQLHSLNYDKIPLMLDDRWTIPYFLPDVPREFETRFKVLTKLMDKTHVGRFSYRNIDICREVLSLTGEVFSFSIERIERRLPHFEKSRAYIEDHLGRDIDIPDLAALEGVSPNYYSARFKDLYGLPAVSYVNSRKTALARRLLSETELLIKEVAGRCGFDDPYYFSRVFKKICGRSPRSFRREIKGR